MRVVETNHLFRLFAVIIVSAILGSYALMQIKWYADFLISGQQSPPYPRQYGTPLPVPDTNPATPAAKPLGADFSQVYFASLALRHGESGYKPVTPSYRDRFGRPPGYPPFMNWLYQALTFLPYTQAFLIHTLAGIGMFLLCLFLYASKMQQRQRFWPMAGLVILLFFYTPIGLIHFERGQFEIFVAAALMLFMLTLNLERSGYILAVLCGILASMKWSTLPFLSTFGLLIFMFSSATQRKKILLIGGVMLVLLAAFPSQLLAYIEVVRHYEFEVNEPLGYSFSYLMPGALAKAIPYLSTICIAVLLLRLRQDERARRFASASLPLAIAFVLQGIGFGNLMHEYHAFDLLAFIPVLPFWLDRTTASDKIKYFVVVYFAVLLVFLFRAPNILFWLKLDIRLVQPMLLSGIILLSSLLFLGLAAFILAGPLQTLRGRHEKENPGMIKN